MIERLSAGRLERVEERYTTGKEKKVIERRVGPMMLYI